MRIGIDATVLYGSYSGVGRAVCGLLRALGALDDENEYLLYCGSEIPRIGELPGNFVWRPRAFRSEDRWKVHRWQQRQLHIDAERDRVKVLHAPAYVGPSRGRFPTVVTIYDLHAFTHPSYCTLQNRWHYRRAIPPGARRAARVVVPSACTRDVVLRQLSIPERRVWVVPLGVDSAFQCVRDAEPLASVKTALGLPDDFLLFVGNVETRKGVPRMIEAFVRARQRKDFAHHLIIAGKPGPGARSIHQRVRALKAEDHVRFLGYVSDECLPHLYNLATAVICPAPWEGFGFTALEAMACGTPVIANDSGALPEVCGDSALMVSPRSVAPLAEAIERVVADPELRSDLVAKGLAQAERFPWSATAKLMVSLYEELGNG